MTVRETVNILSIARGSLDVARRNYEDVTRPILTDDRDIGKVYQAFCDVSDEKQLGTDVREQFLFIVQYLFCPAHLFGGKFPHGFRHEISRVTGIYPSVISDLCKLSLLRYEVYHKKEIDRIFPLIVDSLRLKGVAVAADGL